jgi:putative endonuclease
MQDNAMKRQTPPTPRLLRGRRAYAAGQDAEALAAAALAAEGWQILAQRRRTEAGEIDLIAERDGLLAFIEVKARPSLTEAAFALGPRQRARLVAAAEAWLATNPGHGRAGMRFDVMLIAADGTIRRIADAFRADET